MNRETRERIRQAVAEIASAYPYRRDRNQIAALLRELAEEYQPYRRAGPGAPKGMGVRWNGHELLIGRVLWTAIGQPQRISIDVSGSTTRIVPNDEGEYKVYSRSGAVRIACRRAWHIGQWAEGSRTGRIEGNAIIFDVEAERP